MLPPEFLDRVISLLPTTAPVTVAAPLIDDESFWQRCSLTRWRGCQPTEHGGSWKRLYLEKHLTETIEQLEAGADLTALEPLLSACGPHVVRLEVGQLLDHVDTRQVLALLPRLASLRLCYSVRRVGMDFDWSLFGMRVQDAANMALALRSTTSLASLELSRCMLNDECVRALAVGLTANSTVTHLGICHGVCDC